MVRIYRLKCFFKSQGSLSNGYYTNLLQGHMTEKGEILEAGFIDHNMDLDVRPFSQSFLFPPLF